MIQLIVVLKLSFIVLFKIVTLIMKLISNFCFKEFVNILNCKTVFQQAIIKER
jgi:hypothetical protein